MLASSAGRPREVRMEWVSRISDTVQVWGVNASLSRDWRAGVVEERMVSLRSV
jgi:hypothetical protein